MRSALTFLITAMNRVTGSNPLIRRSDRLEALCIMLIAFLALVSVPVVFHLGSDVHDSRVHEITERTKTLRSVEAQAANDSTVPIGDELVAPQTTVLAQWYDGHQMRAETIGVYNFVRAGERLTVWLDADGQPTSAPESPSIAVGEAVFGAVAVYLAILGFAGFLLLLINRAVHYTRQCAWDREIKLLVDNGGDWVDERR